MVNTSPQRCPFEVLGIPPESSSDQIRSAYLRQALKLHPDKIAAANGVITPADTAAFQEVQHAYEFLSDSKERADYNADSSQIPSSKPSATRSRKPSFSTSYKEYFSDTGDCKPFVFFNVDLRSYFTDSVYSGFTDHGRGFYKVFGEIFHKIHAQEGWFTNYHRHLLDPDSAYIDPPAAPLIGNLDSPNSMIVEFYDYWMSFSTVLDFAWIAKFDALKFPKSSARMMEEENIVAREKAKMEYNELVRALAGFAKEKDTRVIEMEEKKKLEEEKRREEEEVRRAEREEEMRKRLERVLRSGEAEETEDSEELYCVVCNQTLKSEKQWRKHKKSKKHQDKLAGLKISLNIRAEPVFHQTSSNPYWALLETSKWI